MGGIWVVIGGEVTLDLFDTRAQHGVLAAGGGLAPAAALRDVFGALGIDPVPTVRGKVLAYLHEHRPAHYAALGASGLLAAKLG